MHETHSGMGIDNTYSYDTFGRLSSVASNGSTTAFAYNSLGRLASCGNTTFVYDTFGNRIRSTTDGMPTDFTYIRGNLLAGVDSNILYEYNKDGARFQKTVDGVVTKYFLDGHRIMGENRGSNNLRYFYDIDGLCGIESYGLIYNVVRDALGNVVAITQGTNILARYEYDSFGNCKVYNIGGSTIGDVNPFRWKGHYFDAETGFYYINGRYYDPQTASFLQPEVVAPNLHSFVLLNPYGYANSKKSLSRILSNFTRSTAYIGVSNSSFKWPDLTFLKTRYGFQANTFSIVAATFDTFFDIQNISRIPEINSASTYIALAGALLDTGLSIYNNVTDSTLSEAEKYANIFGDIIYIGISTALNHTITNGIASIPVAGPYIALIVGFGFGISFDQFWHGEDILWIDGSSFTPGGKSIDEWIKDWLTELFGG